MHLAVQARGHSGQLYSCEADPVGVSAGLQKHLPESVQPATTPWPRKQCLDPLNQMTATKCFYQAASGVAGEFLAGREARGGKGSVPVCLWKC